MRLLCDVYLQDFVKMCYKQNIFCLTKENMVGFISFLSLMVYQITGVYFLFFFTLEVISKVDRSTITIFLSSYASNCFPITLLVSEILYAETNWVSSTCTLYVCCIFFWRLWAGQELNSFLLTKQGWKQPALMIFLLNRSQKVEILLTKHRNYYFSNKHA